MGRKVLYGVVLILFLAGAAVFFYPSVSQWMFQQKSGQEIENFQTEVEADGGQKEQEAEEKGNTLQTQEKAEQDELYRQMQEYNQEIYAQGQSGLKDPFSYEKSSFELKEWGLEDDMFGYLEIPEMDLELPLYLGASQENMARGAVHLSQTSIPIGGENTNAVIAAHRGYKGIPMFRDIELLEPGDEVTVHNLWGTLNYRVSEIRILLPEEVDQVLIQEGKDMITLLTCHPYTRNSHRYAVYCERDERKEDGEAEVSKKNAQDSQEENSTQDEAEEINSQTDTSTEISVVEWEKLLRRAALVSLSLAAAGIIIYLIGKKK